VFSFSSMRTYFSSMRTYVHFFVRFPFSSIF
jgi:hypothetical protein